MATLTSSPQNQEHYQFDAVGEHVIRHGEAAPIREPKSLSYAGRLDSPRRFLHDKLREENGYAGHRSTVLVNTTEGKITLHLNEKNPLGDTITGSLTPAPELQLFTINKDAKYTVPELVTLLKRYRFFFPDKEEHHKILEALQNFSAQVSTSYKQMQANNGSSENSVIREVLGIAWDRNFTLSVPVFKGYGAESFRVELGVDPTSAGVKLFLDSPELFELEQDLKRRLINEEVKYFEAWCSVIYVSYRPSSGPDAAVAGPLLGR